MKKIVIKKSDEGSKNVTLPVFLGLPGGQMVMNLPAVRETWVRSLSWEDPLEESMATYPLYS